VAGRDRHPAYVGTVIAFAEAMGWPLLADPLSGARRGPNAIAHYDAFLREGSDLAFTHPDVVLRVGDLPTSKPLRQWLASLGDVPQVAFTPPSVWSDPDGVVSVMLDEHAPLTLASAMGALRDDPSWPLPDLILEAADPRWAQGWRDADARAAAAIEATLGDELSEPQAARALTAALPEDATLYVASSMPIRDVETFMPAADRPPRVLSNRGANGIDGTIASAFGAAAADGAGPVALLVGDVAFAYDTGSLVAAQRLGLGITIVLLNNDGGGIFEFLPVAGERDAFEKHVATPHGLDFSGVSTLYGIEHVRCSSTAELRETLDGSLRNGRTTVIEVRTDREENVALHRRVWEAVRRV
jgi:2-succinyl-5-enolpyruvyl-6-hydroxy-3-cyclohexene-1-carboxylate synthase